MNVLFWRCELKEVAKYLEQNSRRVFSNPLWADGWTECHSEEVLAPVRGLSQGPKNPENSVLK